MLKSNSQLKLILCKKSNQVDDKYYLMLKKHSSIFLHKLGTDTHLCPIAEQIIEKDEFYEILEKSLSGRTINLEVELHKQEELNTFTIKPFTENSNDNNKLSFSMDELYNIIIDKKY